MNVLDVARLMTTAGVRHVGRFVASGDWNFHIWNDIVGLRTRVHVVSKVTVLLISLNADYL